jgi:hypothetical protein
MVLGPVTILEVCSMRTSGVFGSEFEEMEVAIQVNVTVLSAFQGQARTRTSSCACLLCPEEVRSAETLSETTPWTRSAANGGRNVTSDAMSPR